MTIRTKVETAASAHTSGFRYVRSNNVAVVSVTGQQDTSTTSLSTVLQACVRRFRPLLLGSLRVVPDAHIFLFVATPFWEQHNALSRRRGIWGNEDLRWLSDGVLRSPSVEISANGGTRFAGLAQIDDTRIFEATDFVRTHGASFLFISRDTDLTDQRIRSIFNKIFPKNEFAVDWAGVVDQIGEGADLCIRVNGGFDDREVSVDAFMSTDLLGRIPQDSNSETSTDAE